MAAVAILFFFPRRCRAPWLSHMRREVMRFEYLSDSLRAQTRGFMRKRCPSDVKRVVVLLIAWCTCHTPVHTPLGKIARDQPWLQPYFLLPTTATTTATTTTSARTTTTSITTTTISTASASGSASAIIASATVCTLSMSISVPGFRSDSVSFRYVSSLVSVCSECFRFGLGGWSMQCQWCVRAAFRPKAPLGCRRPSWTFGYNRRMTGVQIRSLSSDRPTDNRKEAVHIPVFQASLRSCSLQKRRHELVKYNHWSA